MQIHGLDAREGDTAYAFFVVRFARPADRGALRELVQHLAAAIPDSATVIEELPRLAEPARLYALPWRPPAAGDEVAAQQRLVASAAAFGIEEAWFFQTGTRLRGAADRDVDDEDDARWSHGAPPLAREVRFPVDGYPEILEQLDWEDFGIAFKLEGEAAPGEDTLLQELHTLWLAPYAGRFRSAGVTIDRAHHAAHLWVDRFAVPSSAEEQVHHLLWIVSKLDEVIPVLHARIVGATLTQKYGGLTGDTTAPFVLGGNPVRALHAEGGEEAIDRWLERQSEWSSEEVAQMLRELAVELVAQARPEEEDEEEDDDEDEEEDEEDEDAFFGDEDDDDEEDEDEDEEEDEREVRGEARDEDRGRYLTHFAGEVLAARARAGRLDPRAADRLRPVLGISQRYEHRRRAVVEILGAARDGASVPALIQLVEDTPIHSALDAIGKEELLGSAASALGAIGDPAAIPALVRLVTAPGAHHDEPRPLAANALAACLSAARAPRDVDDTVLGALLDAIRERSDSGASAELYFAFGRLAAGLAPARRIAWREQLAAAPVARDDRSAPLARQIALVLAGDAHPAPATAAALRPLIHDALTQLDYDHDYTLRNIRLALRVGEVLPELVEADDLVWLTRFAEPDVRDLAHALLAQRGRPLPRAPVFDRYAARTLDDATLVRMLGDEHVVGRSALVREAGRRGLASARRVILRAAHDVLGAVRPGAYNLLAPETSLLETAVQVLRAAPLDADTIALFDRMLRHPNFHVKWELLQDPPDDDRLIGGMFHVLGERWGWQEKVARQWLARRQGTPAYEAARRRAGAPALLVSDLDDDPDLDEGEADDDEIN